MKRAIYLDDRERDLARKVLASLAGQLIGHVAVGWREEIQALAAKFEEPAMKEAPGDG